MNPESRPISFTRPMPFRAGLGLGVGRIGGPSRLADGRFEAEGLLHERDVVVDRLRHADDAELQPSLRRFVVDRVCAAQRAVAADGEQDADPEPFESSRPSPQDPAARVRNPGTNRPSCGSGRRRRA